MDPFDIIPLTFAFDLKSTTFNNDLKEFVRFFNFSNIGAKMVSKGLFRRQSEIEPKQLLNEAQSVLREALSKRKTDGRETRSAIDLETCRLISDCYRVKTLPVVKSVSGNGIDRSSDSYAIDYMTKRLPDSFCSGKNLWISKVGSLNRGLGIEIFSSIDGLLAIIDNLSRGYQERLVQGDSSVSRSKTVIKADRFVVQKYIERPLLFGGRKMDIRVWVLLACDLKAHVFRECYFRLSSEQFDLREETKFVHLTNNALQKFSPNFEADETLKSIDEFDQFIVSNGHPQYGFRKDTFPAIKDTVRLVSLIAKERINKLNKKRAFEVFGFDFMLDDSFKAWLIEVNSNPSITTPGTLLKSLVPRMIDDALKLTIDKAFPVPRDSRQTEVFPVAGYPNEDNMWEAVE